MSESLPIGPRVGALVIAAQNGARDVVGKMARDIARDPGDAEDALIMLADEFAAIASRVENLTEQWNAP